MTLDPINLHELEDAHLAIADRAKYLADLEINDVRWLMSKKIGRRIVYRLLDQAGVWRISFSTNALTMAFNEGSRNLGLKLVADILTNCPDRYAEMLQESKQ